MKAADGEASQDAGSFARTETRFNFPTSVAACTSVNLSCDKPGRKLIAKIRRAPSKMGDILSSLSPSTNQVGFNLNCFSSVSYLLIFFTIKIYHMLSIGL